MSGTASALRPANDASPPAVCAADWRKARPVNTPENWVIVWCCSQTSIFLRQGRVALPSDQPPNSEALHVAIDIAVDPIPASLWLVAITGSIHNVETRAAAETHLNTPIGKKTSSAAVSAMPGPTRRLVDIDFTLRRVFGKTTFRPSQREIITAALEGHDVFVQAATSFGKSLCFQLPAVIDLGITIVISPLLALMNNQVAALRDADITVETINSTTPYSIKSRVLADLECGHPRTRLLYVTPEYCESDAFRRHLRTVYDHGQLSRIAIDEAHCISEWGHDFRKAFTALGWLKTTFPDVPIMCLTATATARVRSDIISTLRLDPATLKSFLMTTARPNLHYSVRFKSDTKDHYPDFLAWLRGIHSRRSSNPVRAAELSALDQRPTNVSGIIYTLYRRDCEALAARLVVDGIGAKPFHAGLSAAEKDDHLASWVANTPGYDVIVATTAFGMGIDKDNVRFVVHWQIPKSFEGYYQEAGRAGRDGKASACILYYGREDRDRAQSMLQRELLRKMHARARAAGAADADADPMLDPAVAGRVKSIQSLIEYCEDTRRCRHRAICRYFGDEVGLAERETGKAGAVALCDVACDWCRDAADLVRRKDRGLASEEWCSTQREQGAYDEYDYDC
ncbi:hypothetical protein FH972_025906 [Carpinus fangiana]|uniref:ATP-dependent DNA helicase n=1 Tax=Carpinus fangiana TaxID=176857 RepID=A0A5N6L2R5_9ROSI|nr:hypothetical protein FH972_025906 [Carpinus fangiana]